MEKLRYFLLMDGVDSEEEIYQYMDLDYLLRLLESRSYFVKQKRFFPDFHESFLPLKSIFCPSLFIIGNKSTFIPNIILLYY